MRQRARPRGRIIKSLDGPPCQRCGCATEVRKYERTGPKQLARPLYYSRWYCCMNKHCRTTLIMPEEFKVRNHDPPNGSQLLS
jgi:hypothetical protein